jgi:plastocyanin
MTKSTGIYGVIGIVVLAVLAGGYYLSTMANPKTEQSNLTGSTPTPTSSTSAQGPATSLTPTPSEAAGQPTVKEITVAGQGLAFSPSTITVHKGDTVKVTFTSKSNGPHNFVLSAFNIRTDLLSDGRSQTVEFVASKTGRFEFHCEPHQAMGMTGTLVVE